MLDIVMLALGLQSSTSSPLLSASGFPRIVSGLLGSALILFVWGRQQSVDDHVA